MTNTRKSNREALVTEFNERAGNNTFFKGGQIYQQATVFSEELDEFAKAITDYIQEPENTEFRKSLVKEWADVQVTLSNFAWFFEFDGEEAFQRVAKNNLTKIPDDPSKIIRNEDRKILKPEGYKPVDMEGI